MHKPHKKFFIAMISGALFLLAALPLMAAPNLFNGTLTPLGSDPSGNAAKTIPPWQGGITKPPAGYVRGKDHIDPFAKDKPLFTITARNMKKYARHLSEVHKKLLTRFPDSYQMPVYRSRRSCSLPEFVYNETRKNITRARLTDDGNNVEGARVGIPFPKPKSAVEIYWNHNFHYRGYKSRALTSGGTVYPNGSIARFVREDKRFHYYADPNTTKLNNAQFEWRATWKAPAPAAGQIMSMTNTINQIKQPRYGYFYDPQVRKVRRAPPSMARYDSSLSVSGGLRLSDDLFLYNGSPDRYRWKIIGKKEIYVPYNVYRATTRKAGFKNLLHPNHLNPSLMRYELHRLWIIEATLKPKFNHPYHRRVFYVDEDSWIMTMVDIYNAKGALIRGQVGFIKNYYEVPACVQEFDVMYHFELNRYHVDNLKNEFGPADLNADVKLSDFGLSGMKGGVR